MGLGSTQRTEVEKMIKEAKQELSNGLHDKVVRISKDQILKWVKRVIPVTILTLIILFISVFKGVQKTVTHLVEKQFEEPRIQQIVGEAAKDRASTLMEEQIQPDVNNFKLKVEMMIRDVNDFVTNRTAGAQRLIGELQQKTDLVELNIQKVLEIQAKALESQQVLERLASFQTVLLRAQNDDREAYANLDSLKYDTSYSTTMRDLARKAIVNIRLNFGRESRTGYGYLKVNWSNGFDPNTRSLSDLASRASNEDEQWLGQPGLVEYIWMREDYPKKERIQFLIDVLRTYRSLKAVNIAGTHLEKETKINWNPFNIEPFIEWWEKEKSK